MKLIRMFSTDNYKGQKNYLATQKRYEILRTILYFAISLSLFAAGWIHTGSRENLLTIVAVLGCLPACKSAVDMIMFLRFKGCGNRIATQIEDHTAGLDGMFDVVFTSYDSNYMVEHLVVRGNCICGYTENKEFKQDSFNKHLTTMLQKDNYKNVTIKIFTDLPKYLERLEQMKELPAGEGTTAGILSTIKSISL